MRVYRGGRRVDWIWRRKRKDDGRQERHSLAMDRSTLWPVATRLISAA
jgi:hypothetical protein